MYARRGFRAQRYSSVEGRSSGQIKSQKIKVAKPKTDCWPLQRSLAWDDVSAATSAQPGQEQPENSNSISLWHSSTKIIALSYTVVAHGPCQRTCSPQYYADEPGLVMGATSLVAPLRPARGPERLALMMAFGQQPATGAAPRGRRAWPASLGLGACWAGPILRAGTGGPDRAFASAAATHARAVKFGGLGLPVAWAGRQVGHP